MRDLARFLRFRAATLRNSPSMIAKSFGNLPIKAGFFPLAVFRLQGAGVTASAAAEGLDSAERLLRSKADELEKLQQAWKKQKAALDAEKKEVT
jgi:hypothetical protein